MAVEDQIIAMRPLPLKNPFGWLICYENLPLQGIPPKGDGPHLLFFSEETKAQAFIAGRKKYFGEEPLSMLNVDSPDTLKSLALSPSGDIRYAAPPCGIVLDFNYATKKYHKIITPAEVNRLLPVKIARAFGFKVGEAAEIKREVFKPATGTESKPQPGHKRPQKIALISCGALLALVFLLVCAGGVWYGMRRGAIPALSFLATPTPTATNTPTATATPTATTLAWEINVVDDFASNGHGWPLGLDKGKYGSSNIVIQNGKLAWELESIDNCWYWWHPDLTSVADFDASIEVKRTGGSTSGDYGMVVRADSARNSFYYLGISDANQKYAFFIYQNEKWTKIQDWTFNASIEPGNVNRIEVVAKGSRFVFLINGAFAGEAEDARLASGKIGILAELYDHADKIKIEYDQLVLHGNR